MAFDPAPNLTALVMHFKSANQGWSERHWLNPASSTDLKTNALRLVDYRLALLPPSLRLVYAKTSRVGKPPDSIPLKYSYPAAGTFPGDVIVSPATTPEPGSINIEVSQISVNMRVWDVDGVASNRWVHGIPDNRVTAEVLTDAIVTAVAPPPAAAALTSAVDWPTRFGQYMYLVRTLTVCGQRKRSTAGTVTWYSHPIEDMMVAGITSKKTGRPFRQQAGRARVG